MIRLLFASLLFIVASRWREGLRLGSRPSGYTAQEWKDERLRWSHFDLPADADARDWPTVFDGTPLALLFPSFRWGSDGGLAPAWHWDAREPHRHNQFEVWEPCQTAHFQDHLMLGCIQMLKWLMPWIKLELPLG